MVGNSGVGKTCIVVRAAKQIYQEQNPTIGFAFQKLYKVIDGQSLNLFIWDTAGGAQAALIVFDITNRESYEGAKKWVFDLKKNEFLIDSQFILIGNKIDLDHMRQVQREEALEFAITQKMDYYEVSAKNDHNVHEVFESIARTMIYKHHNHIKRQKDQLVCPSCVMFASHKGHEVIEPEVAVRNLRDQFDKNIKTGKLKVESTETILVDIRQAIVNCDQSRNRILKEVDKIMTDLIQTLKNRKNEILAIVDDYFKQEKEQILYEEQKWRERQRICEELLRLSSRKDTDIDILLKSKYITDGLDQLNERLKFNELKLINSLDSMIHHKDDAGKDVNISSDELKGLLSGYIQLNEFKKIQYKC